CQPSPGSRYVSTNTVIPRAVIRAATSAPSLATDTNQYEPPGITSNPWPFARTGRNTRSSGFATLRTNTEAQSGGRGCGEKPAAPGGSPGHNGTVGALIQISGRAAAGAGREG